MTDEDALDKTQTFVFGSGVQALTVHVSEKLVRPNCYGTSVYLLQTLYH